MSRLALVRERRRPARGGGEPDVPAAPTPAAARYEVIAPVGEIRYERALVVVNDGPRRNQNHPVGRTGAVLALALAVAAPLGLHMRVIAEFEQGPDRGIRPQDDAAAVAAVAAVGAPLRLEGLAMEGRRAVATGPTANVDLGLINERHAPTLRSPAAPERAGIATGYSVGVVMLTTRRPRRRWKVTVPGAVANSVSSPPLPTFRPG